MNYRQFKTPFMELYEELSTLNEAVLLKDIIGCKDKHPIILHTDSAQNVSLLNFIDVDATKKANPDLPENPNDWSVSSSNKSRYTLMLKCPNPGCSNKHSAEPYTFPLDSISVWRRMTSHAILSGNSSVEDLALCKKCVNAKKEGAIVGWTMETVGGCAGGKPIKNTTDSLYDYLEPEASVKANSKLAFTDAKLWHPFDSYNNYAYYFRCPVCKSLIKKCGKDLETMLRQKDRPNAADFVLCSTHVQKPSYITDIPTIWSRVPDWLFKDKSKGLDAELTDRGYTELYKLNSSTQKGVPQLFKDNLSHKDPKVKLTTFFTVQSRITLPFVCTACSCEYTAPIATAYSDSLGSVSCPRCVVNCANPHSTSYQEILLREVITTLFKAEHKETPIVKSNKRGYYKAIDILFKYKNNLIGIEYDGGVAHNTAEALERDEQKMRVLSKEPHNIKFIRVRDSKCLPMADSELAKIVTIKKPLTDCSEKDFVDCIRKICQILGYELTTEDIELIKNVRLNNSAVQEYKRKRAMSNQKYAEKKKNIAG